VFAAGEVRAAGWGGLEAVSEITGLARSTIGRGLKDLDAAPLPKGRERRKGGGRQPLSSRDATLIEDLRSVIEPATLRRSHAPVVVGIEKPRQGGGRVTEAGPRDQRSSVKRLLPTLGYSRSRTARPTRARSIPTAMRNRAHQRQDGRGTGRGAARHLGRYQEEELIATTERVAPTIARRRSAARQGPRLRGQGTRQGRTIWRVRRWRNAGWVSVGITSDRLSFAVNSIRRWLDAMGASVTRKPARLTITPMARLEWNACPAVEARVAKARRPDGPRVTSITIRRARRSGIRSSTALFCHITQTWRGRPSSIAWPWSN